MNKISKHLNSLPLEERQKFLDDNQIPESKRRTRRPRQGEEPKKKK